MMRRSSILAAVLAGGVWLTGAEPFTVPTAAAKDAYASNPLKGLLWWVDDNSQALQAYKRTRSTNPGAAKLLWKIASQPQASWYGEWTPNVKAAVQAHVAKASAKKSAALLVAYNIPGRDCGQYSRGGARNHRTYQSWIRQLAAGIGDAQAIVILEPDALPQLKQCLNAADQRTRLDLLHDAIKVLKAHPNTRVYVDAGNPRWISAEIMSKRLAAAGIGKADGSSLNVSNYVSTTENLRYGAQLSKLTSGKHFVIDTSRNGNGPSADNQWCNPAGRALGRRPSIRTGLDTCDAFLWIKRPGESDGTCNGGPAAGSWWNQKALELARGARW